MGLWVNCVFTALKKPHTEFQSVLVRRPLFATSRMWFLDKIKHKWRWHRILFIELRQLLEHKAVWHMENAVPGTQSRSLSPSLQASGERVDCPWRKKKLLNFCASQLAALSSEDFSQLFPSPRLCFVFFKDTLLSLPLLNSLAGLWQQLVLPVTVERGSRSEWRFYFLSRESVAYIMKRKQRW